jgi:pimeloyl-ACP methyl ester carboxylesterase
MDTPETRYVAVDEADVAYQVVGNGPLDLLYCFGLGSHIEVAWEVPRNVGFLTRLAAFSRLIFFDRRGTGASDGVSFKTMPTWEEWTEDIAAVLDAANSKRTAILATLEAGPIAILYTAMHPETVGALILLNTSARYLEADDYSIGVPSEAVDGLVELIASTWGTRDLARLIAPSLADDAEHMRLVSKLERSSATPRGAAAQYDYMLRRFDVRHVLSLIQAPTLVLHASENGFFRLRTVVTLPITSTGQSSPSFRAGTREQTRRWRPRWPSSSRATAR